MLLFGLDVGTNSIGWAVVRPQEKFVRLGSRVFPMGVDLDKGVREYSKNQARRTARGMRRRLMRYKLRRKNLIAALRANGMYPEHFGQTTKELFGLRKRALDEKLSLPELGRVLFHLNQRRGFKSNRKENVLDAEGKKKDSETGVVKENIAEVQQAMLDAGARTLGEYFYQLIEKNASGHNPDEPIRPIRNLARQGLAFQHYTARAMYLEEFDRIWNKQSEYHPILNSTLVNSLAKKGKQISLREHIRDEIIYYQRPLKPMRHLLSKCFLESQKYGEDRAPRVAPRSHPVFQEFRIWQQLSLIKVDDGAGRINEPLTVHEKGKAALALMETEGLTQKQLLKAAGLSSKAKISNDVDSKLKGHRTYTHLKEALGDAFSKASDELKEQFWHTLYDAKDPSWVVQHARKKWGLTEDQASAYANLALEGDYGNLSVRAMRKLLPHLKQGLTYDQAVQAAGYPHHSFTEDEKLDRELEAAIPQLAPGAMRNPLVQQAVGEAIRVLNALIEAYGKPDELRIEFTRELKKPKKVREAMRGNNREKAELREEYYKVLRERCQIAQPTRDDLIKLELWLELVPSNGAWDKEDFLKFRQRVNPKDKEKYKLWLEADRQSVYTGKPIPLSKLFSSSIEVEHIVPYSKSLDNSFTNKSLCETDFNRRKGNRLPYEVLEGEPKAWQDFRARAKAFPQAKRENLLREELSESFLNSQLTNTGWIARALRTQAMKAIQKVSVRNGQLTGHLRKAWGLTNAWDNRGSGAKDRSDHRHHAIDAVVIACIDQSLVQRFSTLAGQQEHGLKGAISEIDEPWFDFAKDVREQLDEMLVSYRNVNRAASTSSNPYRWSRSPQHKESQKKQRGGPISRHLAARGALHEETFYGQISNPHSNELDYVTRKPISYFDSEKKLQEIIDPKVREMLQAHLLEHGGAVKEAFQNPDNQPYMYSKKGLRVPIHRVRIRRASGGMVQLRPHENEKLFVPPGNNHVIAIYEGLETETKGKNKGKEVTKRDYETVSLLEAVKRKKDGQLLFPREKNGLPLLLALKADDMVVVYSESPDEIDWQDLQDIAENRLYRVGKFDRNGNIRLAHHRLANVNLDRDKKPAVLMVSKGTIKCVKVRLSPLGEIIRLKL